MFGIKVPSLLIYIYCEMKVKIFEEKLIDFDFYINFYIFQSLQKFMK